jgi:ribosome biogenesis SPOUT family RNA methylase Rps3
MKYIIEHMDKRLYKWSLLEYTHLAQIVGRKKLIFSNIKTASQQEKLKALGNIEKKSVTQLNLSKACVLDPHATKLLTPEDSKKFEYFIFGGVLGDHPPRKRTEELTAQIPFKVEKRNLGKKQMSTNTAVLVAKMILEDKTSFDNITFQDEISVEINEFACIDLPYRYVVKDGNPVLPQGMIEFLKKRKEF